MIRWWQHALAVVAFLSVIVAVQWAQRQPVVLESSDWSKSGQRGQPVRELVIVNRLRGDCKAIVDAEIIDSQTTRHRMSPVIRNPPLEIGRVSVVNDFPIPFAASWGPAKIQVRRTYHCWPFYELLPIERPTRTLPFEIVPEKP